MKALRDLFTEAPRKYSALKRTCEAQVSRWEWGSFWLYEIQPFYRERHRISKGRRLKDEPAIIKEGMYQYGIDASDRIVVVRHYSSKSSFDEEFFTYRGGVVESLRFRRPEVSGVTRCTFRDERIRRFERVAVGGAWREDYQYDGERLVAVMTSGVRESSERYRFREEFSYDAIGRLIQIRRCWFLPAPAEEVMYRRPQKGESVRDLAETIRTKLIAEIPRTLKSARIKDRAYCVILQYTKEDSPVLPPGLAVGLEKQRQAWQDEKGREARYYVWNVPEFELSNDARLTLDDAELLVACSLFNQHVAVKGNWNATVRLLNEVARALMQTSWRGTLNVTDDFVVVALDYEEEDFRRNVKASVSPERQAILKARGWL